MKTFIRLKSPCLRSCHRREPAFRQQTWATLSANPSAQPNIQSHVRRSGDRIGSKHRLVPRLGDRNWVQRHAGW